MTSYQISRVDGFQMSRSTPPAQPCSPTHRDQGCREGVTDTGHACQVGIICRVGTVHTREATSEVVVGKGIVGAPGTGEEESALQLV